MSVIKLLDHVSNHGNVLLRLGLSGEAEETFQSSPLVLDAVPSLSLGYHFLMLFLLLFTHFVHDFEVQRERVIGALSAAQSMVLVPDCAFLVLGGMRWSSRCPLLLVLVDSSGCEVRWLS